VTIEIRNSELERLIEERLNGARDVEDVLLDALRATRPPDAGEPPAAPQSLVEFLRSSPLVGLEIDLERDSDTGRDIDL
jgi:hypothetical protein